MEEKQCSKCKQVKPVTAFRRRSDTGGYKSACNECEKQDYRTRRQRNPEHFKALEAERNQRYSDRHPARRGEIAARYYETHKAEIYERSYRQRAEQPAINLAAARKWKQTHRAEHKAYKSAYRARRMNAPGHFTADEWKALVLHYGCCLCCGKQEPEIKLTPDHVVPLILGGTNDISNIQPLCHSCNSSKSSRHSTDYRLK